MNSSSSIWKRILGVAALAAAAALLSGCSFTGTTNAADPVQGEGEDTDIFAIVVGDCINDATPSDVVTSVPTVDCASPHDSEVYKSLTMKDGEYPGVDAVIDEAQQRCYDEFEGFVGLAYDFSVSDIQTYFPTAKTWANGDREILCLIYQTDGAGNAVQTVGTLKGSAR